MARPRTRRVAQQGKAKNTHRPSPNLVTLTAPAGAASEAYRVLRTNLLHTRVAGPPKVILLTSPGKGEGKSTICANLGVALAQADRATLVIDCDLRDPTLHRIFGLPSSPGLLNALEKEDGLPGAWRAPAPKLKVVAGGGPPPPPNPAELLGSRAFTELLGRARQEFDHVLLDAPSMGFFSDAAVLATQADGTLLVMDARKTRKAALRRVVHDLQIVGSDVLGVVANSVEALDDR